MMAFRYRYLFFIPTALSLTGCVPFSSDMWRCTATDSSQMHWVQYAPTRVEAATRVGDQCRVGTIYRSTCFIRCVPPIVRWHCIAIDKGGHTWYRNSTNRDVAIRNAQQACLHNTTLGGCWVPVRNCSMT